MATVFVDEDYPITLQFHPRGDKENIIWEEEIPAGQISGAITRISYMFNGTIDGGVNWRHPRTGKAYPMGIQWHVKFNDPVTNKIQYAVPAR